MSGICNKFLVGMGTVENSTVRFGFRFCFYGSVLSRFPKRFFGVVNFSGSSLVEKERDTNNRTHLQPYFGINLFQHK